MDYARTLAEHGQWGHGPRANVEHATSPLNGLPRALPLMPVGLLPTTPPLVSNVGLETYLGAAPLVGVNRYAVAGRTVATGALRGLAVLWRPDPAIPVGCSLLSHHTGLFPAATALVLATVVLGVAGAAVGRQRVAVVAGARAQTCSAGHRASRPPA